jgi:riboflavin transporter FmnP
MKKNQSKNKTGRLTGSDKVKNMTTSAICLALCMVLPLITAGNPRLGVMFGLMHIPILLCGFVAGPKNAVLIGLIAPLMRFMIFGAPMIMPIGVAMTFELPVYGAVTGIMFGMLSKRPPYIYVTLITAMLLGRGVWGLAMWRIAAVVADVEFSLNAFFAGAFIDAIPGIILHIAIIPLIVMALQKSIIPREETHET